MLFNRIFNEMDRLFEPMRFEPARAFAPFPPLNLWEDDGSLFVEAELPGMKLDDIHVTLTEGDQLTISGERKIGGTDALWHRQECGYGRFSRTVTLPVQVNADQVEAKYDAGVLTLTLPKTEAAKPKRITVKAPHESPALT
jgi:HSP20 family protein